MILGFLLTALYWPGIAGAATTPKWGLLAVALPLVILCPRKEYNFTLAHLFGALFVLWSVISLIWTPNRLDGIGELIKLLILAQTFVLGSRLRSLAGILYGMSVGLLGSAIVLTIEPWNPDLVLHTTTHSGLFINSGSLAEISALVLIGLVYYRAWWLCAALLPCVLLPASRGAWLALSAAFTVWLWSKSKLSALVLVALTAALIGYSLHEGFHVESVTQRLGMWSDAIAGMTWLGHGVGSFWTDYAPLSNTLDIFVERPDHLHNDFLEVMFEGGLVGSSLLCAMVGCVCYYQVCGSAKLVLVGFAAEALVGFPLHMPCTGFLAALCLGHLARDGHSLRYLFHAGRIRLQAWLIRRRRGYDGRSVSLRGAALPAGS